MLTAKGEEMDKVLGLEVGADDYVVKPFSLRELLARIHVNFRRGHRTAPAQGTIRVGVAEVDLKRHVRTRDGEGLEIGAKELELLRFLIAHRGEVVLRDTLLARCGGIRKTSSRGP